MNYSSKILKKKMDDFKTAAKETGIKVTHQRMEIYRIVASRPNHPSADEIYKEIHESMPMMSIDTVYRTLWMLADIGLINTVGLRQDSVRFDANIEHHHHFRCIHCGCISDFTSPDLNILPIPREAQEFGKPGSIHVEIRGVCDDCLKQEKYTSDTNQPTDNKKSKE